MVRLMRIGNLMRASRKCVVGRVRYVGVLVSALESLAWAFCLMGQQDIRAAEPKRSLEQEGQALAKEVRQFRPSHNLTNRATLKVRDTDGRLTSVPVTVSVQALEDSWQILYRWRNHQGQTSTVSILHRENQIPAYETSDSAKAGELASAPRRVDPEQSHEPLAGSDFWLCDLGLEFLYWSEQRVIRSEPHSTRMCRVLESKSPQGRRFASGTR